MDTTTAPPVVESTPPVTETELVETPAESIADHAAQFSPERQDNEIPKTPANTGQFANKPPDAKHKAASQRATPEDVQEINRLTRELRETEQRLADKDPHAKDSPRIKTLKRQLAALKALEQPASVAPSTTTQPPAAIAAPKPAIAETATEFTEPRPKIDLFANEEDPLDAYMLALNRWDRKREKFEESQQHAQQLEAANREEIDRIAWDRIQTFAASKPDFEQVTRAFSQRDLPAVLFQAIKRHDKTGEVVYHLAQHPELADQLIFETDGKPLSDAHVAFMQRRLTAALGQAAQVPDRPPVTPPYIPPKPPNPVRTGTLKTADDPPGEASSISDHKKYFGRKAR